MGNHPINRLHTPPASEQVNPRGSVKSRGHASIAQWLVCLASTQKMRFRLPLLAQNGDVAQLVAQASYTHEVESSNLSVTTTINGSLADMALAAVC